MATKKKAATTKKAAKPAKMTPKQRYNLELAQKPITALRKKRATPKRKAIKRAVKDRRINVPRPDFVKLITGGMVGGKPFVEITVDPEAELMTLVVSVNGKAVWEGRP